MILGFTGILPFLGLIPARIAERKGRSGFAWWLYGTTMFVVALPHAMLLKEPREEFDSSHAYRPCPSCAEMIRSDATFCRFCRRNVPRGERLDEHASTAFLMRNLDARSDDTREWAIILLGDRGPAAKEAVPALKAMLDDPARRIRIRAAWALERIDKR
jgi:HEAT repeats